MYNVEVPAVDILQCLLELLGRGRGRTVAEVGGGVDWEGGRDGGREGGRDGGREGGREGRREGGRDGGREGGN